MRVDGMEEARDRSRVVWLAGLVAASGCAALIYEIVWFHLLQIVIGSSAWSLGILLGTFMGGLCLGSALVPRLVGRSPLRLYAVLELAIAAAGVLILNAMPLVDAFYEKAGGSLSLRVTIASVSLLPATIAMGATLPIVVGTLRVLHSGFRSAGILYGANLVGAVAGDLVAGFYLLRIHDVSVATYAAAGINVATALAAWRLARLETRHASSSDSTVAPGANPVGSLIYVVAGLSGLTALSAEILWTRWLTLTFGATVYAFSIVLAAFLLGLGVGSFAAEAMFGRRAGEPRVFLGWCQLLSCLAITASSLLLSHGAAFWPAQESASGWERTFALHFLAALVIVLPPTLLWGASMPLAIESMSRQMRAPARIVGALFAANTLGAIVGAIGTTFLLGASVGTQHALQILVGLSAVSALVAFLSSAPDNNGLRTSQWVAAAAIVASCVLVMPVIPSELIAYGRRAAEWMEMAKVADTGEILYAAEGVNDFVAVSRGAGGELEYHASGKVQASTLPEDMRLQLLLAHLSHLVPPRPANVLVIGCGAGITAGALSLAPRVERLTIAEIEPLAPRAAAAFFAKQNHDVLQNPRTLLRIDDGRHVLATSHEMYDVITTDLIDPWVKGVAALFTREFFDLAKRRLRPGGVVTQFVELYQSSPDAVRTEIATFVDAFPNAVIWGNAREGKGYDLVLLGQLDPVRIDVDALQRTLDLPEYAPVADSLRTIGINSAIDLVSTYAASARDLESWLPGAAINRDRNLRLQYLAGTSLDMEESGPIYDEILRRSTFPDETLSGSAETLAALRARLGRAAR